MARKPPPKLDAEALWAYALRTLGVRSRSVGEVREKLLARAACREDVPATLKRLKEYGFLNDDRLAESFASARLENEGLGRARVVRDLRKRRVAPAVAEKAAAEVYRGTDELSLIEAYLRRKYRSQPLEEFLGEPKNVASAYRRLRTAGFGSGNAIRVLKRFAREAEMLDSLEDSEEPQAE